MNNIWLVNSQASQHSGICAGCLRVVESTNPPKGWVYIELDPLNEWGWICPVCQMDEALFPYGIQFERQEE